VSGAVAAQLTGLGGLHDRLVVVPNGIDLRPFQQRYDRGGLRAAYGVPDDVPLITAIGRLAPEKGFDVLISALEQSALVASGAHLALVGEGHERRRLQNQIDASTQLTRSRIHLLGHVADVAPVISASDLIAVPSRSEGHGIVAIEAMATGRAVVAARVGGLVETVVDGACGLLVPPDDPVALAEGLAKLLGDPILRKRFGEVGQQRSRMEYTATLMVDRIAALYDIVAASKGHPAYPRRTNEVA